MSMMTERVGVIVKSEERWVIVSVISTIVGQDTFELKVDLDFGSAAPKLGTWVVLRSNEPDVYRIDRECDESLLPTEIYKENVMLRTPIYFQEKGQDGYGLWVWAPKLGKVAAVCHDKYNPKQTYVALVARTAARYRACVEYNWMLTKYIAIPGSKHPFDNFTRSSGDGASDSDSSLLEASNSGGQLFYPQATHVDQATSFQSNAESDSVISKSGDIEIFRGVVAALNNVLVVVEPKGRVGLLRHNRCDISSRMLKMGDWVAVAGQRRSGTKTYDVVDLPSLIKAEMETKVQQDTVLLLSTIRIEGINGNEFCGSTSELGNVMGNITLLKGKNECAAWCCPRSCPKFQVYWEAVELMSGSSEEYKIDDGRKVRFSSEYKVHYFDHEGVNSDSTLDGAIPFYDVSEEQHQDMSSRESSLVNIYAVITRVVSNPAVREAIKNYRPKELLSIDKAIGLKF